MNLKKNERLIFAGHTALRAPDGTPLPAVPQFVIVSAEEANPAHVTPLGKNERLILAGRVFTDRKRAEERFAALKAGHEAPPREEGTPLYVVEDKENLHINDEEQKALALDIARDITALFSLHMRRLSVEEKQRKAAAAEV
jgi:hypothetical protein